MSRSRSITLAVATILSVAQAPTSLAQEGRQSLTAAPRSPTVAREALSFTPEQQAQLADLAKSLDARVLAGFRGREDLKARMDNDLRDIAKISDRSAKVRAIAVFQERYSEDYRKVLSAGGVDMRQVAERLSAIFPGAAFAVENGTHLVEVQPVPPPPAPPPPPPTTRQSVTGSQMTQDPRSATCGGVSTGRIDTSRSSGQTNSAHVRVIGNCGGTGFMNYRFEVPEGMKSRITGRVSLSTDASAAALSGAALASAEVITMRTNVTENVWTGFGTFPRARSRVFVAVAWAASHSDPRPRQAIEETDTRGQTGQTGVNFFRARTFTSTWSAASPGDAEASASVQDIDVVITMRAFSSDETR